MVVDPSDPAPAHWRDVLPEGELVESYSYVDLRLNVGLGDGSIRFVRDSIDLTTWRNLSTMQDGLVITGF